MINPRIHILENEDDKWSEKNILNHYSIEWMLNCRRCSCKKRNPILFSRICSRVLWTRLVPLFEWHFSWRIFPSQKSFKVIPSRQFHSIFILTLFSSSSIRIIQHTFTLTYRKEGSKQYELKAGSESECNAWVQAIDMARLVWHISSIGFVFVPLSLLYWQPVKNMEQKGC